MLLATIKNKLALLLVIIFLGFSALGIESLTKETMQKWQLLVCLPF